MSTTNYFIGLMSGTSLDGIDASLCEINEDGQTRLIDTLAQPYADEFRHHLQQVCKETNDHLHVLATLDHELANKYADTANALLKQAGITPQQIRAIGCHGQTVRHCPDCNPPYTMQLGNPHRLVAKTGISVVADFRQQDMAAGGQGAPLAPRFHQSLFSEKGRTVVAVNLGGIANISILHSDGQVTGHDTGPANTLMDQWIRQQQGKNFDENGAWAASGKVNSKLLEHILQEPWLKLPPPKSTGPELFNLQWLTERMDVSAMPTEDVQRTLCEFSAVTIADAIKQHAANTSKLILCGGGSHNRLLKVRLKALLPEIQHFTSDDYGIPPDWIESAMMAWFAYRAMNNLPGNIPAVTGANRELVLGVIYPAPN